MNILLIQFKKVGIVQNKKFESLFIHNFDQLNQKEFKNIRTIISNFKKKID